MAPPSSSRQTGHKVFAQGNNEWEAAQAEEAALMVERVQRAMIESSLQASHAYTSSRNRGAMDELYMDLKGLQLTKQAVGVGAGTAVRPSEPMSGTSYLATAKSNSSSSMQHLQSKGFNWEQAHLEWEQAQRAFAGKEARNSMPAPKGAASPYASAQATKGMEAQPWSGASAAVAEQAAVSQEQHQLVLQPGWPQPKPRPPVQELHRSPSQQQQSPQLEVTATTTKAGKKSDDDERELSMEAGQQWQPPLSKWKAMQEGTKAFFSRMGSRSKPMGDQQQQQQQQKHGEEGAQLLQAQHEQAGAELLSSVHPGSQADTLPHHHYRSAFSPHHSQNSQQQATPSSHASLSSLSSQSTSACKPNTSSGPKDLQSGTSKSGSSLGSKGSVRGLSSSLALPHRSLGGVLGKGSLQSAMAMLLGTDGK